ncbi:MAG: hypothetical protein AUG02_03015 [Chloroflexi bacterium 13_1_20CM_2_70_9]|nr:MAG: hypothetical protein AUG02_03015 [Chloroflexi bacterium 13_1_20CM_2_70_9]
MIGTWAAQSSARSARATLNPSSRGRRRSMRIASGRSARATSSADTPSTAERASWPDARMIRWATSRLFASSSTTSTRAI